MITAERMVIDMLKYNMREAKETDYSGIVKVYNSVMK